MGFPTLVADNVGFRISSPCFHPSTQELFFCSSQSGEVRFVNAQGGIETLQGATVSGIPSSIVFDPSGVLYIADVSEQVIWTYSDGELSEFVREYESKPFRGSNSMTCDSRGNLFFTDSGPFGETSIQNPRGSVFAITAEGSGAQLLQPLALDCLASPAGIALSSDESCLFVAETCMNRILRFIQKPTGVFHFSVFYQFAGGFGPSALCTDAEGALYVAHFDPTLTENEQAKISVLSSDGVLIDTFSIPGSEITGLVYNRSDQSVYITEASLNSIYRIQV